MSPFLLRLGATTLTLVAAAAFTGYVTGHVKNGSAPLRPTVVAASGVTLTLTPSVRAGNVPTVTSTYAS
ncbi:MAG: hypothetical protein M3024_09920 [Candidatus Dormibacteraeota bacterium]|nr:hypothetical protein [Candidatus Dormibacteraeota bacterium]